MGKIFYSLCSQYFTVETSCTNSRSQNVFHKGVTGFSSIQMLSAMLAYTWGFPYNLHEAIPLTLWETLPGSFAHITHLLPLWSTGTTMPYFFLSCILFWKHIKTNKNNRLYSQIINYSKEH